MKQARWQWIILLIILAYEGLGGLLGGVLLSIAPDGHLMNMPPEMMRGVFTDFLIPGLILTGMGALTTAAFFAVLFNARIGWLFALLSMGGYIIWFTTEILILGAIHWLHIMWGVPVLIGFLMALPMLPLKKARHAFA